MTIPLTPAARIDPTWPPTPPPQSRVIDLVIVTAPNPPGSRQPISPPAAVFEIAPAKVSHGAVRLHGLTSSPTPEIHVRVAWACAAGAPHISAIRPAAAIAARFDYFSIVTSSRGRDRPMFCNVVQSCGRNRTPLRSAFITQVSRDNYSRRQKSITPN